MKKKLSFLLMIVSLMSGTVPVVAGAPKWQGSPPGVAKNQGLWVELLAELVDRGMYFGAMAASARIVAFFQDLPSKEAAYKTVIQIVNRGYPFSAQSAFLAGDLTPSGEYDFVNNYNLYKSILNREKGMEKWADYYMQNVDKENFSKYQFYLALEAYAKGDLKGSEERLRKILTKELDQDQGPFVKKVARTLARVLFDREEYAQSYDIYSAFLLKLNPAAPSDWLEAAWNLYYLRRYQDALGMLYNLESRSSGSFVSLEKYTIRALVYRNLCAVPNAENLIESFDKDFGPMITGLKRGESASKYPQLVQLDVPGNNDFQQVALTVSALQGETAGVTLLSQKLRALASYLYRTEVYMLTQKRKAYSEAALERAASKLLMMREHLRFLNFDVQREKFNPDVVFRPLVDADRPLVEEVPEGLRIRWKQFGDYWRDERLKYRGVVVNRCTE